MAGAKCTWIGHVEKKIINFKDFKEFLRFLIKNSSVIRIVIARVVSAIVHVDQEVQVGQQVDQYVLMIQM